MAVPNLWRTKKQRYSLHGEICNHCSNAVFPPREVCPHCHKPMQSAPTPAATRVSFHFSPVMTAQAGLQPAMVGDD